MITITSKALTELVKISRLNKVKQILLSVQGGGCNGFKYNISTDFKKNKQDEVINIHSDLDLVIDHHSIFYIIGSNVDWKEDIMGSRFDFQNPNASSTCGCGTTFSMENEEF